MNKRNKPASLTSSLLARKGEAEPAIEPYSFVESGESRTESAAAREGADASGLDDGGTGLENAPGDNPGVAPSESGSAAPHDMGASPGSDLSSAGDREMIRDRRLLRFVYSAAVLTGVMAVVIYAGGWFFGDNTERTQVRSRTVVLTPPPAPDAKPDAQIPMRESSDRSEVSPPPKPPAPPATRETESPRGENTSASAGRKQDMPNETTAAKTPKTKVVAAESKIETRPKPTKAAPPPASPATAPKAPPPAPKKAVVAARATGTPAPVASGRYYIQLASVPSESAANRLWGRLRKDFPDILGEYDLTLQKRVIANKGTFYRVQVGRFATFKDVRGLCDLLKARKQACLPVKR